MSLRLAVATEDFGTSLRRAIPLAGQAQVSGVRLNARREILAENISDSGLRQLLRYITENRMTVAGLSCPTRHSLAAPEYLEERMQLIRSAMELARPLQTSHVLVPCGPVPDPQRDPEPEPAASEDADVSANPFSFASASPTKREPTPSEQFNTLCQVATDLAGYGNHVGCVLTLQLPDYNLEPARRLLASVTSGPLELAFDPAVAVFTGRNVAGTYRDLYPHVGYVRARDGIRHSDYSGAETAVGEGAVEWDELLPTLIEADFTGWVCVERTGGDHRATDVLKGVARVKSLLPQPTEG